MVPITVGDFEFDADGNIFGPDDGYLNTKGAELFNTIMDGNDAAYNTMVMNGADPYREILNRLHLDHASWANAARLAS